ncbi:hypothetical protein HK405_006744 [Cladochytrium tenue]|nr:hypothetical protein HK405_006744 [Cladochytrium tenue]
MTPAASHANRALVATEKYGPLQVRELPLPAGPVGPGKVRVRVRAAGVNPIDFKILRFGLFYPDEAYPRALGAEGAGEVVEVGPGVTAIHVGDRVLFNANLGDDGSSATYQEYSTVEAEFAFKIPDNLTYDDVAIQLANKAGFTVIATASPRHHAYLRDKLGAAHVFDYNAPDVFAAIRSAAGDSLQHVFDAGGSTPEQLEGFDQVLSRLAPATSVISVASPQVTGLVAAAPGRVVKYAATDVRRSRNVALGFWAAVPGLFARGELVPPAVRVVEGGLGGVEAALVEHEEGRVSGFKYVVRLQDDGKPKALL